MRCIFRFVRSLPRRNENFLSNSRYIIHPAGSEAYLEGMKTCWSAAQHIHLPACPKPTSKEWKHYFSFYAMSSVNSPKPTSKEWKPDSPIPSKRGGYGPKPTSKEWKRCDTRTPANFACARPKPTSKEWKQEISTLYNQFNTCPKPTSKEWKQVTDPPKG